MKATIARLKMSDWALLSEGPHLLAVQRLFLVFLLSMVDLILSIKLQEWPGLRYMGAYFWHYFYQIFLWHAEYNWKDIGRRLISARK